MKTTRHLWLSTAPLQAFLSNNLATPPMRKGSARQGRTCLISNMPGILCPSIFCSQYFALYILLFLAFVFVFGSLYLLIFFFDLFVIHSSPSPLFLGLSVSYPSLPLSCPHLPTIFYHGSIWYSPPISGCAVSLPRSSTPSP